MTDSCSAISDGLILLSVGFPFISILTIANLRRIAMDKTSNVMPRRRHEGVVAVACACAAGTPDFGAGEIENPYEVELVSLYVDVFMPRICIVSYPLSRSSDVNMFVSA